MDILACSLTIITLLCFLHFFHRRKSCKHPLLPDYPLLGMLPPVLFNLFCLHDFITDVMKHHGGTGEFRGPWFTNMTYIITSDSLNVQHILCKRFDNYVKGPEFREIFQAFGDGVVTADSNTWKYIRTLLHSLIRKKSFEAFLEKTIRNKIQTSLVPVLDQIEKQGTLVDLQDVFNRFTFDKICSIVVGYDPKCLSIDFPEVAIEKAFNEAEESIFYRHIVPKCVWKFQKLLQIGQEKKMTHACKTFDQFLYSCIASKRQECKKNNEEWEGEGDLLTCLMREENNGKVHDDKFLRDASFNMFVAGRETITSALTWFFWLLSSNPLVESKIVEEIKFNNFGEIINDNNNNNNNVLGMEEVKKLVYLHGALCESLRLFPPVPLERKQAIKSDTLPSGHRINPNTMILISLFAMGRNEEIWGEDCLELKPERWISNRGGIVYPPSHKFISFNAGPRTCLGKDLSFIEMKMVAATILTKYHVKVVQGIPITPTHSIILLMKHGLKVELTKRDTYN